MSSNAKILLIGFGNPARQDDGIGPAMATELEKMRIPFIDIDADYQLNVEDAESAARHDIVIFADADVSCAEPFRFVKVAPSSGISFSSHSVDPQTVIGMARQLFGSRTNGYLLGVRGYEFREFTETITDRAAENMKAAIEFIAPLLSRGSAAEIDAIAFSSTKEGI